MNTNITAFIGQFAIFYVPFLFALCFHEFSHAWMAKRRGDDLADSMGRLTMNPLAHMDPIGTFVLPLMAAIFHFPFIGWAKPVPVNTRNLANPKNDMFLIALAGPVSNLLQALVGNILLVVMAKMSMGPAVMTLLTNYIWVNLLLAVFNMIPIEPLDGQKVITRFMTPKGERAFDGIQRYLQILFFVGFMVGALRFIVVPVIWLRDGMSAMVIGFFSLIGVV